MCTFSNCWSYYVAGVLSQKSKRSQTSEAARWRYLIKYFNDDYLITDIHPLNLINFQRTVNHLSPQSVAHCLSLLRRVINYSIKIGFYAGPCPKISLPKFDNKRLRFLSRDEAQKLLDELKQRSDLWYDISLFALNTGLRAGEIYNLTFGNFDRKNRVAYVMKTKNLKNRTIPLNEIAFQILARRVSTRAGSYIFMGKRGKEIKCVDNSFKKAVTSCGFNSYDTDRLNRVVFHTLRHTFASWLVQDGIPLAVVSELLGHSSINITMRYAHLAPSQGRMAVETIAKRLTD